MLSRILKQTAIHEVGHVIMAYYLGYSCQYISLDNATPGEGVASISWHQNQRYINIITNPLLASERSVLSQLNPNDLNSLLQQFIMVLSAGTAAEIIYEKNTVGSSSINNLNGMDNDFIADFIDVLISAGATINDEIVNLNFQVPLALFAKAGYWLIIDGLADLLLSKTNFRLTKQEIEEYLVKTKFHELQQ